MRSTETIHARWPGADDSLPTRLALRVLQASAVLVVLVAAPYKVFDLDRFFIPKELVLGIAALSVTLLCLARARRFALTRTDELLALWLIISGVSALLAGNWWLAGRSLAISLGGVSLFWCARALTRAGHGRALVAALALAGVIGAVTSLLQAYGVRTDLFSLNRAPGGTFGNRNFMAHLCVITLPALLFAGLRSPTRAGFARWCGGIALVLAALILSRSRAAWLALAVAIGVLLACSMFALRRRDKSLKMARLLALLVAAGVGGALALVIPNTLDWRSDSPYADTAHSLVNYKGGSGHGRLVQYKTSLRMTLHHPLLGVGPGNWPVVYPTFAADEDPSLGSEGMTSNPWPSSDLVAFLSERGPAAFVVLALALLSLTGDGLRYLRNGVDEESRLGAAVLLSTLVAVAVVGAFDAVLLLAVPALIGFALLGALSPASDLAPRRVIALPTSRRVLVMLLVAVLGGAAVFRSAAQLTAMSVYSNTSRAKTLERAALLDPGSYRIHVRLAAAYVRVGSCKSALVHAKAARKLFPAAPAPKRIIASCGG